MLGILMAIIPLGGCGRSRLTSYRYKLTLALDTPDGARSASTVVQVETWWIGGAFEGVKTAVHGDALYLDMGASRKPLIALLTRPRPKHIGSDRTQIWSETEPTWMLARLYGDPIKNSGDYIDVATRLSKARGPRSLSPAQLPELVSFDNVADPKSVVGVDANNLEQTFGPGVRWKSITLEVTEEPVSVHIEHKLPWLSSMPGSYLNGMSSHLADDNTPSGRLQRTNFMRRGV